MIFKYNCIHVYAFISCMHMYILVNTCYTCMPACHVFHACMHACHACMSCMHAIQHLRGSRKVEKSRKIKTFGNHLKPLETFGNHWKPFGNLRKASETLGKLRKPSKTFKNVLKKRSFGTKWVKFWSPLRSSRLDRVNPLDQGTSKNMVLANFGQKLKEKRRFFSLPPSFPSEFSS